MENIMSTKPSVTMSSFPTAKLPLFSKKHAYKKRGKIINKKVWSNTPSGDYGSIENAALSYFKNLGFHGWNDEGYWINQTIRSAILTGIGTTKEYLEFANNRKQRFPTDPRNYYAQGLLWAAYSEELTMNHGELIDKIRCTEKKDILNFIENDAIGKRFHASPTMTHDDKKLYQIFLQKLDMEFIAKIASKQVETQDYAGFPDLTLWDAAGLKLVEVKSPTDRLSQNQKGTFANVLTPIGARFEIARIIETECV
jgi:hypothetical protein